MDEPKDENYIPLGINAGGINISIGLPISVSVRYSMNFLFPTRVDTTVSVALSNCLLISSL